MNRTEISLPATETEFSILPLFKIRCSSISKIMGGNVGLSESQAREKKKLEERTKALTPIMVETLVTLNHIEANPELPKGAKTYCEEWLKTQIYGEPTRHDFKYTSKGLEMEEDALAFVAENFGYGMLLKNDIREDGEYITGEADNVQADHTIDTKCSWLPASFPLFEDKLDSAYYWQGLGYMHLYKRANHKVFYCLMNTPIHLIENEAKSLTYKNGYSEEESEQVYADLFERMTFDGLAPEYRIKEFIVKFDQEKINQVIERVKMCRDYIKQLICK